MARGEEEVLEITLRELEDIPIERELEVAEKLQNLVTVRQETGD